MTCAVFGAIGVGEIAEALDLLFLSLKILGNVETLVMMLFTPCVDGRILVAFLYVASRRNYLRHFIAASRTQF